jgi:hypothetical protein
MFKYYFNRVSRALYLDMRNITNYKNKIKKGMLNVMRNISDIARYTYTIRRDSKIPLLKHCLATIKPLLE